VCRLVPAVRWLTFDLPGQSITVQVAALVGASNPPPNGAVIRSTPRRL